MVDEKLLTPGPVQGIRLPVRILVSGRDSRVTDHHHAHHVSQTYVCNTPRGMFTQANLQYCVETIGADRIMYAVDYPFVRMDGAQKFLSDARLGGRR